MTSPMHFKVNTGDMLLGMSHPPKCAAVRNPCMRLIVLYRSALPGLRALIVLPTRDLALQVYQVLVPLCPALGLTACVACGKVSLPSMSVALTIDPSLDFAAVLRTASCR